jgi:hypothetical protein
VLQPISSERGERLLNWIYDQSNPRDDGKRELSARRSSDFWERLTVGGVVCILIAFLVLFIANLATTLCAAQLPR